MSHNSPSEEETNPQSGARAVAWVVLLLLCLLPFWCWIGWGIGKALVGI